MPYKQDSISVAVNAHNPDAYDEIIEAAERLSKPFPHVRIDF